jgi:hypothetical protein
MSENTFVRHEPVTAAGEMTTDRIFANLKMIVKYRLALASYHRKTMNDPTIPQAEKQKVENMVVAKMQQTAGVGAMLYQSLMAQLPKSSSPSSATETPSSTIS